MLRVEKEKIVTQKSPKNIFQMAKRRFPIHPGCAFFNSLSKLQYFFSVFVLFLHYVPREKIFFFFKRSAVIFQSVVLSFPRLSSPSPNSRKSVNDDADDSDESDDEAEMKSTTLTIATSFPCKRAKDREEEEES